MTTSTLGGWPALWLDTWSMGLEASAVIGLRCARIARGGMTGCDEARLMVSEKVGAALAIQTRMASDPRASPLARSQTMLRHYARLVHANRQRLSV